MVNIEGLKKSEVLCALYNNAKCQGLGILQFVPGDMTENEAESILSSGSRYFDYVHGRVMKVDLSSDKEFDERLYDRDNGPGAAQRSISEWRDMHR